MVFEPTRISVGKLRVKKRTKVKERVTSMKTMIMKMEKAIKSFVASYKMAMSLYGEALMRGRGLGVA